MAHRGDVCHTLSELWIVTVWTVNLATTIDGIELYLLAQVDELVAEFVYLITEFVNLVILACAIALRLLV